MIDAAGHANGERCLQEFEIEFPQLCDDDNGRVDIDGSTIQNLRGFMVIAPNPASTTTHVYYEYISNDPDKTIEVQDILGRKLWVTRIRENSGSIEIDCSRYAHGQYLVVMKAGGETVQSKKLQLH